MPALGRFRDHVTEMAMDGRIVGQLAAVILDITARRTKFKLGQNRPPDARRHVIEKLRERGRVNDGRAADALEGTLSQTRTSP